MVSETASYFCLLIKNKQKDERRKTHANTALNLVEDAQRRYNTIKGFTAQFQMCSIKIYTVLYLPKTIINKVLSETTQNTCSYKKRAST